MFKTRHAKIKNGQNLWVSWGMLVMSVPGGNRRLTAVCWYGSLAEWPVPGSSELLSPQIDGN